MLVPWGEVPSGQTSWKGLRLGGSQVKAVAWRTADYEGRCFVIIQCGSGSDSDRFTAVNPQTGKGDPRAGLGITMTMGTGLRPDG